MDGQMDGQTELRQQYRALHYMQSHGKNGKEHKQKAIHQYFNFEKKRHSEM